MSRPLGDYISAQFSIISSIIHSFTIVLVIQNKKLRKVLSYWLLINLSLGHFLTGITNFIGTFVALDLSKVTYAWYVYANISLLTLTVDRSFSIFWPFRYQLTSTRIKIFFVLFSPMCCLAYIAKMSFLPTKAKKIADADGSMKFFIFGMGTEMTLLVMANSLIFLSVRKQRRKIAATTSVNVNIPNSNTAARRNEIARFYVCFGCIITYVVLWTPAILLKILEIYGGLIVDHKYFSITIAIANINPIADSFMLLFFNRELKGVLKKIIGQRSFQSSPNRSHIIDSIRLRTT